MIDKEIINQVLAKENFKNIEQDILLEIIQTLNSSENDNEINLKNKIEKILKV